ncbi:hypothetical protein ACFL9T_02925 [Thermodesulfobacteriota bacterium]
MDLFRKIGTGIVMIVPTFVGGGAIWNFVHSWTLIVIWIIAMAICYRWIIAGRILKGEEAS